MARAERLRALPEHQAPLNSSKALVCDDRSEAFEVAGASVRIGGRTADIEVVVHHQGDPAIAVGSRLASAMRRPPLPQRPAPREATASRRAARWWDRADVRLVAAAADLGVASWQLLVEGALDGLDPCAAVHATATASELQHNGLAGSVRRAWDHALEELLRADWPALRDQVADLMDAATVAAVGSSRAMSPRHSTTWRALNASR